MPVKAKDPDRPTDEELGIGEEDDATGADPLAALLADPRVAALIEKAVEARLGQMAETAAAAPPQANGGPSNDAFEMLAKTLGRLIEVNQAQQPGYIKPLPMEEVERRMQGKVDMDALLVKYEQMGLAPLYTVGESGFFECSNAAEFPPGMQIRTYLPPVEDFIPENEPAHAIMEAHSRWLGVPTAHIGEQVEAFMKEMKAAQQVPLVSSSPTPMGRPSKVEVVKPPPESAPRTRRVMGTVTPERHNIGLAERAAGPVGPVHVGADAV